MTRRLLAALLTLLLLGALASPVLADTFEEYAARVGSAYELVLGNIALVDSEEDALELADEVDALLPGSETVVMGDTGIDVDDSIVSALTTELRTARTADERREAMQRLGAHLQSLVSAVGERVDESYSEDPEALAELLSSAEDAGTPWLAQAVERALAWLEELFAGLDIAPTPGGELLVEIVLWVIGIGLVGLLVWLIVRAVRARRERPLVPGIEVDDGDAIVAAAEGLPEDPLSHADRLAGEGRFRDALRALFGGAARELVRFGVVRQTRTMTNGELLRAVRRTNTRVHEPLRSLAGDFEIAWYGHIDPGRIGYDAARERYRAVLAAAGPTGGDPQ